MYAYFDVNTAQAAAGEEITLVLSASGYDESWNPVALPVEGAAVTANGEDTGCVTDGTGSVTLTFAEAGVYVIKRRIGDRRAGSAGVCGDGRLTGSCRADWQRESGGEG